MSYPGVYNSESLLSEHLGEDVLGAHFCAQNLLSLSVEDHGSSSLGHDSGELGSLVLLLKLPPARHLRVILLLVRKLLAAELNIARKNNSQSMRDSRHEAFVPPPSDEARRKET